MLEWVSLAGYAATLLVWVFLCRVVYDLIQHLASPRSIPTAINVALGILAWATLVASLFLCSRLSNRLSQRLWGEQIRRRERIKSAVFQRFQDMTPEERAEERRRDEEAEFALPRILERARRNKGADLTSEEIQSLAALHARLSETNSAIKQLRLVQEAQLEARGCCAAPPDQRDTLDRPISTPP